MIRPEKFSIAPRRAGVSGSMIALGRARVTESLFQGTHVRLRALGGTNGDHALMLRLAPGVGAAVGGEIGIWAEPADVVVLESSD